MRLATSGLVLYCTLGLTLGLPSIAIYETLGRHGSIAEVTLWLGLIFVAWAVKPLYGVIADAVPIRGQRRVPYLIMMNATASVMFLILATGDRGRGGTLAVLTLAQFAACFADVMTDAIVCASARDTETKGEDQGKYQSKAWMLRDGFGGAAAIVGGLLTSNPGGTFVVFAVQSSLYALNALVALLIEEPPYEEPEPWRVQLRETWRNLRVPAMRDLLLYQILISLLPSEGAAFYYFMTRELGFNTALIGGLSAVGVLARLGGYGAYYRWFRGADVRTFFLIVSCLGVGLRLPSLLLALRANAPIPDLLMALSDDVLGDALAGLTMVPLLVVTAHLARPSVEAAVYTTNASVSNLAGIASRAMSAQLTRAMGIDHANFKNLWVLILLCATLDAMIGVPAIFLLPRGSVHDIIKRA